MVPYGKEMDKNDLSIFGCYNFFIYIVISSAIKGGTYQGTGRELQLIGALSIKFYIF